MKNQESKPIYMKKNHFYTIEARLKESKGSDYLILGVQGPVGGFVAPVPSGQLFHNL